MEIENREIVFQSKGNCDLIDLTPRVNSIIQETGMSIGHVLLFVPGATGGLTTIEYEGGLIRDFKELWEKLVPSASDYHHNERWGRRQRPFPFAGIPDRAVLDHTIRGRAAKAWNMAAGYLC